MINQLKRQIYFVILIIVACWVVLQVSTNVPSDRIGDESQITYEQMFREIAQRYDLDWRLLARQAYRESALDPQALGRDNDMGLMQILPSTWDEWAPHVDVSDPFDPYSNVLVGAAYLAFLRDYFASMGYSESHWMLVSYNWGPNNLQLLLNGGGGWNDIPTSVQNYALDILDTSSTATIKWDIVQAELVKRRSTRR